MDKTYYIENLGCAKNQVDAETMIAALSSAKWTWLESPDDATVIIVNTCGFINPAKEESINVTLAFRDQYPNAKIVMAGCLTQRYGREVADEMAEVDGVFGNRAPDTIPGFLDSVVAGKQRVFLPEASGAHPYRSHRLSFAGSTFVKISEGCRNRCSFCAIPLIRGSLRSRSVDHILDEIERLRDDGVHEINLVAQDLSAYGLDRGERDLPNLLERIAGLRGEFWIRMLYIYPETFPREVLEICRSDSRFLPYFDIPMQHAATSVLRRMGRPGSSERYRELITQIRDALPDAVLRTSFLVGFVGETEEEFDQLLRFQREASLDWAGTFKYSIEEGTPAYFRRDEVPDEEVATRRKEAVDAQQEKITAGRLDRFVGRTLDVLIEELVQGEELALGRGFPHAPEVDGAVVLHTGDLDGLGVASFVPGTVVSAIITRRNGIDLEARPVLSCGDSALEANRPG